MGTGDAVINDPILLHKVAYECLFYFVRDIAILLLDPSSCHVMAVLCVEKGNSPIDPWWMGFKAKDRLKIYSLWKDGVNVS